MSDKLSIVDIEQHPEKRKEQETLKQILNQDTPENWLKGHPFVKKNGNPLPYLPIERVEYLLDILFIEWKVEVINVAQLFNSVSITIRLHYLNPVNNTWNFHDGVGAVGVQTDKGKAASDLTAVKQDAVMKALPAAKSYAIKDAAEHLGQIFGRNVNRADNPKFNSIRTTKEELKDQLEKLFQEKRPNLNEEDITAIEEIIINEASSEYRRTINTLKKL